MSVDLHFDDEDDEPMSLALELKYATIFIGVFCAVIGIAALFY